MSIEKCVMQPWTFELTMMQQSVLLTAVRGPDGIHKNHIAKVILRWYRRCILRRALNNGDIATTPEQLGGGSFTGPMPSAMTIDEVADDYIRTLDEIPHHFQLHLLHAAEILGYKHPDQGIRNWWFAFYVKLCSDMHLMPEAEEQMDYRLGDNERQWRDSEVVTAD